MTLVTKLKADMVRTAPAFLLRGCVLRMLCCLMATCFSNVGVPQSAVLKDRKAAWEELAILCAKNLLEAKRSSDDVCTAPC
mgnify:CR=1 FL=1